MNMEWKSVLKKLEQHKNWDYAIDLMEEVIKKNPHDKEAYLAMCYLLMNYLVEEDHTATVHSRDECWDLCKKYFCESYTQFSSDPEYLYYIGRIGAMSPWYFDIDSRQAQAMIDRAIALDPNNIIFQSDYYEELSKEKPQDPRVLEYAKLVQEENSPIKKILQAKGSLGEDILEMINSWSEKVLAN